MAFFWYQRTTGKSAWLQGLSDQRQKVIKELKPPLITVLDCLDAPDDDWSRDDFNKLKYTGPLYFDWDSDDISQTIPPFHEFLTRLEEGGVNLKALRLYATGGRGFHCEIPEAMVNPKPTKAGVTLLPYVYKEMAFELATECMDFKVYTARKGRMWRTPGVERVDKEGNPTGRFKVPITLDQAWAMTPELYVTLTSRACEEPYREPPTLSTFLSPMFEKARKKVESLTKLREKHKGDADLLARFAGEFPPTVRRIMAGEGISPHAGFHSIALQLAITANALGKDSETFVAECEGLAQKHQSDSQRYNSPRKRKEELRRMWEYIHSSPELYTYSKGGIKSLCAVDVSTSDLDSPIENLGVGHLHDDESDIPDELQTDIDNSESSLMEGLFILRQGIYQRKSEGVKKLSNVSFGNPRRLVDLEDREMLGLELDLFMDSRPLGRHTIQTQAFRSKTALNDFCLGKSAVFNGSDNLASLINLILSRKAMKENKTTYIISKEGLDLVLDPSSPDQRKQVVWSSSEKVETLGSEVAYRFRPKMTKGATPVKSDLHTAAPMEDTEEARTWLRAMLTMNSPVVVGLMLGWFVSCFHKQFYQSVYNQFPLLHPNGAAGSGKTQTTSLLAKMFYNHNDVFMVGASRNGATAFSLKGAWTGSASVPVIIDEFKPSELGAERYDFLLQHFRLLYNQGAGASGGVNRGGAESSFQDITQYTYSAPTVYIGESQEMMTAIVQRTVAVSFSQGASSQHTESFDIAHAEQYRHLPARLGALLRKESMLETVKSRVAALDPIRKSLRQTMSRSVHDRQVYNLAVVIAGLEFLGSALRTVFDDEFDGHIAALRSSIVEVKEDLNTYAMSESSKVLNDMALISRTEEVDSEFALREGYEYVIGDGYLELLVKESFVKYFAWSNRKGFKPLYSNADGFIGSVMRSPAMIDPRCFDSKLRGSSMSKVFRFRLDLLQSEGVELFKSKFLG